MRDFEPGLQNSGPIASAHGGSAPEVPLELGRLLQQLFVALEDYIIAPPESMPNISEECGQAMDDVGQRLIGAGWTIPDIVLLVDECVRRLPIDDTDPVQHDRKLVLQGQVREWIKGY
jgi:hypothetical protein